MEQTNRLGSAEQSTTSQLSFSILDSPCHSHPMRTSPSDYPIYNTSSALARFSLPGYWKNPLLSPVRPQLLRQPLCPRTRLFPCGVLVSFRPSTHQGDSRRSEALEGLFHSPRSCGIHSSHEVASSQPNHTHRELHLSRGISGQMPHCHCPIMLQACIQDCSILCCTSHELLCSSHVRMIVPAKRSWHFLC